MEQTAPITPNTATPSFIQALFDQLHARQRELGLTDKTLMQITDISKSTFYRIWHDRAVDPHIDFIYIEKLCAALQIQLSAQVSGTPAAKVEISEAVQAEVAANTAELLTKRKEVIDEQAGEIETLSTQLTEKQQSENEYQRKITELYDEIRALHRDYNRRIEELQKELNHRQDQMCELFLRFSGNSN
jgi:DNA-binding Xre family transcriptional regulator